MSGSAPAGMPTDNCGTISDCFHSSQGLLAALAAVLIIAGIAAIIGSGGAALPILAEMFELGSLSATGDGLLVASGAAELTAEAAAALQAAGIRAVVGTGGLVGGGMLLSQASGSGGGSSTSGGGSASKGPTGNKDLDELLKDPQQAEGRPPQDLERQLDQGLDPKWTKGPVKKGVGTRWYDGKGNSFTIERQPQVGGDLHSGWYLKVARAGKIIRVPLEGNPALGGGP